MKKAIVLLALSVLCFGSASAQNTPDPFAEMESWIARMMQNLRSGDLWQIPGELEDSVLMQLDTFRFSDPETGFSFRFSWPEGGVSDEFSFDIESFKQLMEEESRRWAEIMNRPPLHGFPDDGTLRNRPDNNAPLPEEQYRAQEQPEVRQPGEGKPAEKKSRLKSTRI